MLTSRYQDPAGAVDALWSSAVVVLGWYFCMPSLVGTGRYTLMPNCLGPGSIPNSQRHISGHHHRKVTGVEPTERGRAITMASINGYQIPTDASANVHQCRRSASSFVDLVPTRTSNHLRHGHDHHDYGPS